MRAKLNRLFNVEPHERLKFFLLTATFFFVIASYTITKELKDSIFTAVVGREYIPMAKILAMLVLVPAIFIYSKLVDSVRRYQLLCGYSLLYGVAGLVFAFLVGHPTIGIANTDSSPWRIFGWLFYFFIEGYSPFVVSVFWAFANSVSDPASAKKNYGLMVSGSKLGGMMSAGFAWMLLSSHILSDVANHQVLLLFSSAMVFCVPFMILRLMKKVSGRYLHGYEAVYQVEKQKEKEGKTKTGVLSGLYMLIQNPYILGIFSMVFFYEMIATVLSYHRVMIAQSNASSVSDVSSFFFQIIFVTHAVGFLISLFGTRTLLNKLGERICLLLIPVITGVLLLIFMLFYTHTVFIWVFVALRSMHYAFSYPVRESLYIPTVKEVKFKSKSWIDAFGSKFAKSSGSTFNSLAEGLGANIFVTLHSFFFAVIIGFWFVAAYLLGKRFERAVANDEVIGFSG